MGTKNFKVELHCHLDGSLPAKTIRRLVELEGHRLSPEEVEVIKETFDSEGRIPNLVVSEGCSSLDEYLKCFDIPVRLLQTPESMWLAGKEITEELSSKGVDYAEIRFAPQLHSEPADTYDKYWYEKKILEALLKGIKSANFGSGTHTHMNVILCMMRNDINSIVRNARTLLLAKDFLGKGVVAVDLAETEAQYATSNFKKFFDIAREGRIPFTIHAGEAGDREWRVDSIRSAIEFGARRIGHGIGLMYSEELMDIVREKEITIECCLKSNLDTHSIERIEDHPIKKFLDAGIRVTINTDNMTVSNTTLDNEYELVKKLGITDADIKLMQKYAIEGSFASKKGKAWLMKKAGFN